MTEILQFAFSPAVFLFSVLLIIVLAYWVIVASGLLSTDVLDGHGGDVGGFHHGDVGGHDVGGDDVGHDGSHGDPHDADAHAIGGMNAMLAFFYVGRVPLTVLITVLVFVSWMSAVLLNIRLNPTGGGGEGLWLGLVSLGVGLAAVKIIGWPFAKLLTAMTSRCELRDVSGKVCTLLTTVGPGTVGQAEIRTAAAPVIVTVVTDTDKPLARGQEAVIVRRCGQRNAYLVSPVAREAK